VTEPRRPRGQTTIERGARKEVESSGKSRKPRAFGTTPIPRETYRAKEIVRQSIEPVGTETHGHQIKERQEEDGSAGRRIADDSKGAGCETVNACVGGNDRPRRSGGRGGRRDETAAMGFERSGCDHAA
jgi:hypothetical protein